MDLTDASRHVPWIVFEAKDWLDAYLEADMTALEWGSGGSTIYLCQKVREVVSIEHDPEWFAQVSHTLEHLDLTNCSYHLIEPRKNPFLRLTPYGALFYGSRTWAKYKTYSFRDYVKKIEGYPDEHFDFILVDGRARASCLRHAVRKLKPNGVLALDNSERAHYQSEMARLAHMTHRDFFGNGPFLDKPWQTTIWFRQHGPKDLKAAGRAADGGQFACDYDLESLEKITAGSFGFDMYVTPRFRHHYAAQAYEELTSRLIRQSAKGAQTFVDVGAHYGFFAVLVGLSNPDCRILAFEPVPENSEIIGRNLRLNGVDADVHQAAVSDVGGHAEFQVSEASDNSGFVANPAAKERARIHTEVVCLDQFIDQVAAGPVLVKIDVEGNELRALEGMRRIIDEREDVRLVIEFNPRCLEANGTTPEALLDLLDRLGFDVHFVLDSERQYARFRQGSSWNDYMGDKTNRNLYCVKKSRSLSLCVLSHTAKLGGAELSLLELIDSMTKSYGTVFTVVLPSMGPLQGKIEELGAATMPLKYHWWCSDVPDTEETIVKDRMLTSLESVDRALPALFALSPDVVLTNTLVIPWGAVAALKLNRPHIWWVKEFGELDGVRGQFYQRFDNTLEIVAESSNHVVVNSEAVKEALFAGAGPEKCSVAVNRVTLPPPVEHAREYFSRPGSTKLIIASSVRKPKGQDDAVHAVIRLLRAGYDVELCIVGHMEPTSAYYRELRDLVTNGGAEGRIHFVEFLENVRPVMEQAQISLVCSKSEAFGRTTAESMLLGRPVIGTNTGGTPELIEDGVNGFLYSPEDVEQLAARIAFFADHPEAVGEFGRRAGLVIAGKLATNPVDSHMYELCHRHKQGRNPYSQQLTNLLLGWQQKLGERPNERGHAGPPALLEAVRLRAELDELAERSAKLREVYASTSWRITAPMRMVGDATRRARQSARTLAQALFRRPGS